MYNAVELASRMTVSCSFICFAAKRAISFFSSIFVISRSKWGISLRSISFLAKHRREFDLIYLLFPIFLNPCVWFPLLRRTCYLILLHEHFYVLLIIQ